MNAIGDIIANSRLDLTRNCTLEAYALDKMLPVEFLRNLGVETVSNPYAPSRQALCIPYSPCRWIGAQTPNPSGTPQVRG